MTDDRKLPTYISLRKTTREAVEREGEKTGRTRSNMISHILDQWAATQPKKGKRRGE